MGSSDMLKYQKFDYNDKLSFLAEWFDFEAALDKKFILNYFPSDNSIELFDTEQHRTYLRRTKCDGIQQDDMFIGNSIRVYGRQIKVTDYADCRTKERIGKTKERTFAIIKPSAMNKLGEVLVHIENHGFKVTRLRMCQLSRKEALDLYESQKGDPFLPFVLEHLVSGLIIAVELVGEDAIERFRKILGPDDPIEARKSAPQSMRALYGEQRASNGLHASKDYNTAVREACFFFPEGIERRPPNATVLLKNTTCCVIKPHALAEGKLGYIISAICESEFRITAMQMFYLSNANADEFLEVYKGVVGDFHAMLLSFLDGPCVALEVAGKHEEINTHDAFRKFTGPYDSELARQIRPYTLRARFGVDKYRNAIHCTDLADDTVLELEYFFKILDG